MKNRITSILSTAAILTLATGVSSVSAQDNRNSDPLASTIREEISRALTEAKQNQSEDVKAQTEKALTDARRQIQDALASAPGFQTGQTDGFSSTLGSNLFQSPGMGKKARQIMILRQMLNLKLTERDIEKALPILKQMRDMPKEKPVSADQAMDEELNALLKAKPGDPLPPSSASGIRSSASRLRDRNEALWNDMTKAIGKEKTIGIRSMISSGSSFITNKEFFAPFLNSWNNNVAPSRLDEKNRKTLERYIKPVPPDDAKKQKSKSDAGSEDVEVALTPVIIQGFNPGGVTIERESKDETTNSIALTPDRQDRQRIERVIVTDPASPFGQDQPTQKPNDRNPAVSAPLTYRLKASAAAKQYSTNRGQTYVTSQPFAIYSGRVSLDELIELMEKKLAAMKAGNRLQDNNPQ